MYQFDPSLSVSVFAIFSIGRFSEAGLQERMLFVIFCAMSCERSQHHFQPISEYNTIQYCIVLRNQPEMMLRFPMMEALLHAVYNSGS